ncbi:MAG: helix-turn-helix domain-containing protein [Lachnospiraceae bacterium]|nr:helix-turn-helix domain-containing protein [Lachnospiraceae bacterium]
MTANEMIAEINAHTEHMQSLNRSHEAFDIVQTKWYARVLFELCQKNPSRFGEIKRAIPGISNVVLTSALRSLEERKLITRVQYNEIPPHVEYSLTERGEAMLPIFYEMVLWEKKYMD